MNCREVDELAGAYALDAVDRHERAAVAEHLDTCRDPHAETRSLLGLAPMLALGASPVEPSAELRGRVMAAINATPQEHAGVERPRSALAPAARSAGERRFAWRPPRLAGRLGAVAAAASVVLAIITVSLWSRVQDAEGELRAAAGALAAGEVAFRVTGDAGAGYLVQAPTGEATLIVAAVPSLPEHALYELWLISADGQAIDVGTFRPDEDGFAVVPLERGLDDYAVFAVTVERGRVDAPTGDPVLTAGLGG